MKKRGIIILILLVITGLFIPVFAQLQNKSLPASEDEAKQQLQEGTKQLTETAKSRINEKITGEVNLPENLKPFARLIFGIKSDEAISLNIFMILIAIWILFFVVILKISQFFAFFKDSLIRIIFSVVVTCLVSLTGSLKFTALYLYELVSLFKSLEKIPALATAAAVVIIIFIAIITKIIAGIIEGKLRKEEMRIKGKKAGFGAKIAEIFGKMFKE